MIRRRSVLAIAAMGAVLASTSLVSPARAQVAYIVDETNNAANSDPVVLRGSNLELVSLDAPPVAFRGLSYPATVHIRNSGDSTARDLTACLVGSRNPLISVATDTVFSETAPMTLAPSEEQTISLDFTVPAATSTGAWYLEAIADCRSRVGESEENDNIFRMVGALDVRDPAPDFAALEVDTATEATAGEAVVVAVRLSNVGNRPGAASFRVVASTDPAIAGDDRTIYDSPAPISIEPGGESSVGAWAPLPSDLASGTYYIGVLIDPDGVVDETVESNNASSSGPISVHGSGLAEIQETNNVGRSAMAVLVSAEDVAIVSDLLPPATVGVPYFARVRAAGGDGRFVFRLAAGTLPEGASFEGASGELSGTPAAAGSYPLELEVTSAGQTARKNLSLDVLGALPALTVVTRDLPAAILGEDYVISVRAAGGTPPYRYRLVEGALPAGLTLDDGGELAGAPLVPGLRTFTVEVADSDEATTSASLSLEVRAPLNLTIVSSELPAARLGEPYTHRVLATGGAPPYGWTVIECPGADPTLAGLTLAYDGVLSGTPVTAGMIRFCVEVTDRANARDRNAFSLEVTPVGHLAIATAALPEARPGEPYRAVVEASGGDAPYAWEIVAGEGVLPPGLTARSGQDGSEGESPGDLVLSGTVESEGLWSFTVQLRDAKGLVALRPFAVASRRAAAGSEDGGCGCGTAGQVSGGELAMLILLGFAVGRARRVRLTRAEFVALVRGALGRAGEGSLSRR